MKDDQRRFSPLMLRLLLVPIDHPGIVLGVTVVVIIISLLAVMRLRPSGSLESMIAENNPAAVALGRLLQNFGSLDDLILVATDADASHTELQAQQGLLDFAQRLRTQIDSDAAVAARVTRVRWGMDADAPERRFVQQVIVPHGLLYLDAPAFAAVQQRLAQEAMREQIRRNEELIVAPGPAADRLARALLQDPLRLREFMLARLDPRALGNTNPMASNQDATGAFSTDGRSLLVRIGGARPASDLDFTQVFLRDVQAAANRANISALELGYTGSYAIAAASERAIRTDMKSSVVSSVLLIQLLFLLLYRRLASFALAFAPVAVAILTAFGVFSLLSMSLTPATAVVGAVLAGMGDDFSMHFMSHYDHRRERGDSPRDAALGSAVELVAPMLAALLTSLVGFIAIMQSSVPALRDFAWISALGLAGSMIAALTILPALLVTFEPLGVRRWMKPGHRLNLEGIVGAVDRRRRALIALMTGLGIVLVTTMLWRGGPVVPVANDLRVMHPQPNPALDLQERLPELFGDASSSMLLHVRSESPDALLRDCHALDTALRSPAVAEVGVVGVLSLAALLPDPATVPARLSQIRMIDGPRVLADFDIAVQDSLFNPAAFASFKEFLSRFLAPSSAPTINDLLREPELAGMLLPLDVVRANQLPTECVAVIFLDHPQRDTNERDRAIETIRHALRDLPGVTLTGLSVLAHDTHQAIRSELFLLAGIATLAVLALVGLFYRHPRDVLLVLLPLAFGVSSVLVLMHVTGDGLNPINLVAVPLLIGAGEDYGVYVVSLARQARAADESLDQFRTRLAASMHALTGTWLTTMLGFGSLMFTSTPAIQSLGRMTVIGLAACFLCTLFGLVPILLTLHRRHMR